MIGDKVYTPPAVAKALIGMLPLHGSVLDPFRGKGAFYDNLPRSVSRYWCEIDDGRDFFDCGGHFDWIVSNPPYSMFTEVMRHSYEIADNIAYLIPLNKIASSWGRVKDMREYGGIRMIYAMPSSECGFPFGFPACLVWIQRGYRGPAFVGSKGGAEWTR